MQLRIKRPFNLVSALAVVLWAAPPGVSLIPRAFAQSQTDIRSFGARCNGSDDTGAIQAALNALPNGGMLAVSCTASITQVTLHNKGNVTVTGTNGGGFSLLTETSDDWAQAFHVEACSSCTIKDLVLEGNSKNMTPFGIAESANTTVQGLTIRNTGRTTNAFTAMHNNGNKYLNNRLENVGLQLDPGTNNAGRGMWIGNVSDATKETNVTVSGNIFDGISGAAIAAHGSGMTITNNHGTGLNWSWIKVLPLGGSGSTLIANNEGSGAGARWRAGGGIMTEYYNSSNEQTVIRDNILEGYAADDVARGTDYMSVNVGINIANQSNKMTHNVQILNNTIRNFWYDSVQISGPTDNFLIEGNILERTISNGTQWVGINLQGDQDKVITNGTIRRNVIRGKFDGIQVNGRGGTINGITLDSNSITSISRDGVHVEVNSGSVSNVAMTNNCFSAIANRTVWDNRSNALALAPLSSGCADPGSGATLIPSAPETNTPSETTTSPETTTPPDTSTPPANSGAIRINAGGAALTDSSGTLWSADTGSSGGYSYVVTQQISGASTQDLYRTQRWNNSVLDYNFAVPNGTYTLTLKFSENYFGSTNQRIFDVSVNGQGWLSNFDIAAAAGGPNRAVDRSTTVSVTNGRIALHFVSSKDDPAVNAIEIVPQGMASSQPPNNQQPNNQQEMPGADLALRINAGGPALSDSAGSTWSADPGGSGGYVYSTAASIANTDSPALYQTLRWDVKNLAYNFSVAEGAYRVTLKFAEIYFGSPGQRVFNVVVNGQTVLSNFDIVAEAGGPNLAVDRSFTVNASGGQISIAMTSTIDDPQINAIEIVQAATT